MFNEADPKEFGSLEEYKAFFGGKGAGLVQMTSLGLPIPFGFIIPCKYSLYYADKKAWPLELKEQINEAVRKLETQSKLKYGNPNKPLLVSVRSGAPVSMPGMMDTVLNLGLNDLSVQGVISKTKNERFAWDSYRRFIQMFGDVVIGVEHAHFEEALDSVKKTKGVEFDTELNAADLKKVVEKYKTLVKNDTKTDFPQEPKKQLQMSIDAVFGSWNNARAITYRRLNDIKGLLNIVFKFHTGHCYCYIQILQQYYLKQKVQLF